MPFSTFDWGMARRITDRALHVALNTQCPFTWYYAGFTEPRRNPYRDEGPIQAFRNF